VRGSQVKGGASACSIFIQPFGELQNKSEYTRLREVLPARYLFNVAFFSQLMTGLESCTTWTLYAMTPSLDNLYGVSCDPCHEFLFFILFIYLLL
jgi:hypothetical protein